MSKFTKADLASPDDASSGSYAADRFLWMLNELQQLVSQRAKTDLIINSACRTAAHNSKVGGASRSKHLTTTTGGCMAADIHCTDNSYRDVLIHAALEVGFKGFGLANTFIHLDARQQDRPSVWGYGSSTDWLMDKYETHIRAGISSGELSQPDSSSSPSNTPGNLPSPPAFDWNFFSDWFKQDDLESPVPINTDNQLHHKEVKAKKNELLFAIIGGSLLIVLLIFAAIYSIKH